MLGENCIKILSEGLSYYPVCFKNVQIDVESSEKDGKSDAFTYFGEQFCLNSAEQSNMDLRNSYEVHSFDIEDICLYARTRNFQYYYTTQIVNVLNYLLSVLNLARDVNTGITGTFNASRKVARVKSLSKDEKDLQALKITLSGYADILLEIKTRIQDLGLSRFQNQIQKTYANLDNLVRTLLFTSSIPDELAENFNSLYEGISLIKFSSLKKQGVSLKSCIANCRKFTEKLYNAGLKLFLSDLMEEFFYYVTSDLFLNNPKNKTIFVVPLSMYKKFNFKKSGLTREETVFLESKSIEKTCRNLKDFYAELESSFSCIFEKAKLTKAKLTNTKDEEEIEFVLSKYEQLYKGQTNGNISGIRKLIENPVFREKFTRLLFELRPEIVEVLLQGGNPWDLEPEHSKDTKRSDKATVWYLSQLMKHHYPGLKMHTLRLQIVRFLRLYSHCDRPEKSYTRYFNEFYTGKKTLDFNQEGKFKKVLDL